MKIGHNIIINYIVVFIMGAAGGIGAITLLNQARPAPIIIVPPEPTPLPPATPTPGLVQVYVNGAVHHQAVYALPPNSLVQQAIEAAGGFTNDANSAVINLAQPLNDGLQIYVPTLDEEVPTFATINEPTTTNSTRSETINVSSSLININTATKAELETLPGIGPSTAQNILDHRDANGPFQTIENIMDVSGIGDGRFEQVKDLITIGE